MKTWDANTNTPDRERERTNGMKINTNTHTWSQSTTWNHCCGSARGSGTSKVAKKSLRHTGHLRGMIVGAHCGIWSRRTKTTTTTTITTTTTTAVATGKKTPDITRQVQQ